MTPEERREHRRAYQKAYRAAHRERILEQNRAWKRAQRKKKAAAKNDGQPQDEGFSNKPEEVYHTPPPAVNLDADFLATRGKSAAAGGSLTVATCRLDCFNCPYPDCKADGGDILRYEAYLDKQSAVRGMG